jgi:hypothetical protein
MQTTGPQVWLVLWKAYEAMREHAHTHIESGELGLSDFGELMCSSTRGRLQVNADRGEKIRQRRGTS